MSDVAQRVWVAYHLGDTQADHPLRLLVEENRTLRAERDHILSIARDNGRERDAARRVVNTLRADMEVRCQKLAVGYRGGACLAAGEKSTLTLHYDTSMRAEQAFAVITDMIDQWHM